jgi:hypothetical protein
LQLLHFGSDGRQDWVAFEHAGMLAPDYTAAFELYLEVTELQWPGSVGDPEVALFLAICDMAINPTEGFPYDITNFAKFRENTDPGVRFIKLCQAVKEKVRLPRLITGFTRDEYLEATQTLAEHLRWQAPLDACATIESWREYPSMAQLMEEDQAFRFTNRDLPVRVFSSRFFAFQQDKLRYPQVLVWPGAYSGGRDHELSTETIIDIFARHEPLFVDLPTGEVRPNIIAGRDRDAISETWQSFYSFCADYQLVRQWHVTDGPFDLNFGWLTPEDVSGQTAEWARGHFRRSFGYDINDFEICLREHRMTQ